MSMPLLGKIENRSAVISVIGLGYVGLPLAVVFAEAGYPVVGIDTDKARVNSVNSGVSYIREISSDRLAHLSSDGTDESSGLSLGSGKRTGGSLVATNDYDALRDVDVAIICVPTPLGKTRDPDMSFVVSAADDIAKRLHQGMLVVLESTAYPGATEEIILPQLRQAGRKGLVEGTDFLLAFSPERVDPGQTRWTVSNTPKVVGGVTSLCAEVATSLYQSVVEQVVPVSSPKTAEMVKLLENTFRATNIAMVNEIGLMCEKLEIDVWEVIEAAKTKPFGFMPFQPGPGLGGHCLPVDPEYLAWKLRTLDYTARFVQLAAEINTSMPAYWVGKVQDALNNADKPVNKSRIVVLGVTYKRDVPDTRESPALDIISHLLDKGANVSYHDPFFSALDTDAFKLASLPDSELYSRLSEADCALIVTDHSSYDWQRVLDSASLIVDTRNAVGGLTRCPAKTAQ
jgi:UDP-N-acetyl-D-glucosamine dehydrogenase